MKLGPNQTRWVEALRSGEYKQGRGVLCRDGKYCCLGVAAEIFKTDDICIRPSRDDLDELVYDGNIAQAPDYVIEALGLWNAYGVTAGSGETSLTFLNDAKGLSFRQIAETIETNPEQFFKESR